MLYRGKEKWRVRWNPRRLRGPKVLRAVQWLLCLVALAVIGLRFLDFARCSDAFQVRWIRVEGAQAVLPAEVVSASGITAADNVLFFDANQARRRVEDLAYVAECSIERVFPDRVVVTLEERRPVATLVINNHLYEIDGQGMILRRLAQGEGYPGPLITNLPGVVYAEPGQRLDNPSLDAALAIWQALEVSGLVDVLTVSELAALGEKEVLMFCRELPFAVRWGRGDALTQAQRLAVLLDRKGGRLDCEEYLDLRFDADLACR